MTCWWCGADTRYLRRAQRAAEDSAQPTRSPDVPHLPVNGSGPVTPAPMHVPPPALSGARDRRPGRRRPTTRRVPRRRICRDRPAGPDRPRPDRPRRPRRPAAPASRPAASRRKVREARPTANPQPAPVLATAVYLSGTSGLEVGGRYGFVIDDDRLRLVGPHDPSVTAFERPIAGILASISQGNLLLTVPDRKLGTFLAFRAVAGMSLEALVRSIAEAAEAPARP